MTEDSYGLETQNMAGLRYQAVKAGVDHRGMSRARLISVLRDMREQNGGTVSPVPRLPKWLRDGRYKRPRFE